MRRIVALGLTLGLATVAAAAFPVLSGDPVDPGTGRAYAILPGIPLLLPQPNGKFRPPIVDPTRIGDVDLVIRTEDTVAGPLMPPPVATPPVVVAGGPHVAGGTEIPFTVLVSDGGAGLGTPLGGPAMDGIPVIVAAFADLDGDGWIGPTDADPAGALDNDRELQETNLVGRQVAVFDGGVARGQIAITRGGPASAGGLDVVLTALAYVGAFDPGFFAGNVPDGPGVATLLPFFPRLDPDRIIDGNGRGGPASPDGRIGIELSPEFDPPVGDPQLGTPFALPTDGSSGTIDRAVVIAGAFSRARFVRPSDLGAYPIDADTGIRPGAGGALYEPLDATTVADDGPGNATHVRLVPVDVLDDVTDPPAGASATLVAGAGLRIVAPDTDGNPARETVALTNAAGIDVALDDTGGAADSGLASNVTVVTGGFPVAILTVQLAGGGTPSNAPTIAGAALAGPQAVVLGCKVRRTLAAVVTDPQNDALTVGAKLELDGASLDTVALMSGVAPAGVALPPGPVYVASFMPHPTALGQLTATVSAHDPGNLVATPVTVSVPVVASAAPTVGAPTVVPDTVPAMGKQTVIVTAVVSDACALSRVVPEVDSGFGFRRAGRLRDDGKRGDAIAGDGIFTGQARFRATMPAAGQLRVTARNRMRQTASGPAAPLTITVP